MKHPILIEVPEDQTAGLHVPSFGVTGGIGYIRADLVKKVLTPEQQMRLMTEAVGDLFD